MEPLSDGGVAAVCLSVLALFDAVSDRCRFGPKTCFFKKIDCLLAALSRVVHTFVVLLCLARFRLYYL